MDVLHILLRIIVLIILIPFGVIAAIIPAYAAGCIISYIGLSEAIGQYLVGGIALIFFCGYFQYTLSYNKIA